MFETSADFPAVREFRTVAGRFFEGDEVQGGARVAVVGQTVLANPRAGGQELGETIRIGNIPFEVIGILEPKGVNYAGVDENDQIFIPITAALRRLLNLTSCAASMFRGEQSMGTAVRQVADLPRDLHRMIRVTRT